MKMDVRQELPNKFRDDRVLHGIRDQGFQTRNYIMMVSWGRGSPIQAPLGGMAPVPIQIPPPISMQIDAGDAANENLGGNKEIVCCGHKLFQTRHFLG